MKTMARKYGVCAASLVLLLAMTALVIGCADPFAGPAARDDYQPPAGMGFVRLNVGNTVARTIMPETPEMSTIASYRLTFSPVGGGADIVETVNANAAGQIADPIVLPPATYSLAVIAYLDAGSTTRPMATATVAASPGIVISAGSGITQAITLNAYSPATGLVNGTFEWDVDLTGLSAVTLATATLDVVPLALGPAVVEVDLDDDPDGDETVMEGYYFIDVALTPDTGKGNPYSARWVLHVYRYLTSLFELADITDAHFGVYNGTVGFPNIGFGTIGNTPPDLSGTGLNPGYAITVTAGGSAVTLTVDNDTEFDGGINWYHGTTTLSSLATFSLNPAAAPFNVPGIYIVTVVGLKGGAPNAAYIEVTVQAGP